MTGVQTCALPICRALDEAGANEEAQDAFTQHQQPSMWQPVDSAGATGTLVPNVTLSPTILGPGQRLGHQGRARAVSSVMEEEEEDAERGTPSGGSFDDPQRGQGLLHSPSQFHRPEFVSASEHEQKQDDVTVVTAVDATLAATALPTDSNHSANIALETTVSDDKRGLFSDVHFYGNNLATSPSDAPTSDNNATVVVAGTEVSNNNNTGRTALASPTHTTSDTASGGHALASPVNDTSSGSRVTSPTVSAASGGASTALASPTIAGLNEGLLSLPGRGHTRSGSFMGLSTETSDVTTRPLPPALAAPLRPARKLSQSHIVIPPSVLETAANENAAVFGNNDISSTDVNTDAAGIGQAVTHVVTEPPFVISVATAAEPAAESTAATAIPVLIGQQQTHATPPIPAGTLSVTPAPGLIVTIPVEDATEAEATSATASATAATTGAVMVAASADGSAAGEPVTMRGLEEEQAEVARQQQPQDQAQQQ